MTTNLKRRESRMLELVRQWRKAAYEAEPQTPAERQARDEELIRKFGLKPGPRDTRRAAG
jgi:hypothetical protein